MSDARVRARETTQAGQAAIEIVTPTATWTYQPEAGGFSSLRDRDGVEWIGFMPGTPGPYGPANVFRGIPNLVYPDNIGHPGYDHVRTSWTGGDDGVELATTSTDGRWSWRWTVNEAGARLEVLTTPADQEYWFLYEGVPGGRYDPEGATWGCDERLIGATTPVLSVPITGSWRWIWFGHRASPRVLVLHHETAKGEPSMLGWMRAVRPETSLASGGDAASGAEAGQAELPDAIGGEGMVVFGFGRSHADGPVSHLGGQHEFTVRFVESTDPEQLAKIARTVQEG